MTHVLRANVYASILAALWIAAPRPGPRKPSRTPGGARTRPCSHGFPALDRGVRAEGVRLRGRLQRERDPRPVRADEAEARRRARRRSIGYSCADGVVFAADRAQCRERPAQRGLQLLVSGKITNNVGTHVPAVVAKKGGQWLQIVTETGGRAYDRERRARGGHEAGDDGRRDRDGAAISRRPAAGRLPAASTGPVDLNAGDRRQLEDLPGVGPATAGRSGRAPRQRRRPQEPRPLGLVGLARRGRPPVRASPLARHGVGEHRDEGLPPRGRRGTSGHGKTKQGNVHAPSREAARGGLPRRQDRRIDA